MNPQITARLQRVRLIALDIDGILTDGKVMWIDGQGWTRQFNIRDGYGIKTLLNNNIPVAIMSGSNTEDVKERMSMLKIPHIYLGNEDKLVSLQQLEKDSGIPADQMLYMGDDVFDLPVLERVGFSASVPEAVELVREKVHYITRAPGGTGAAREVIDMYLKVRQLAHYKAT